MRLFGWRMILVAAIAGAGVMMSAGAQAYDDDRRGWDRRHYHKHHKHKHGHWRHDDRPRRVVYERAPRYVHERGPRYVYERAPQVIYERQPVVVAPAPVYMAPMAPSYGYGPPADPSLNLNFNIPLR
jgi:hypothetical protein